MVRIACTTWLPARLAASATSMALLPPPTTSTRLPRTSSRLRHALECIVTPANTSRPGTSGITGRSDVMPLQTMAKVNSSLVAGAPALWYVTTNAAPAGAALRGSRRTASTSVSRRM